MFKNLNGDEGYVNSFFVACRHTGPDRPSYNHWMRWRYDYSISRCKRKGALKYILCAFAAWIGGALLGSLLANATNNEWMMIVGMITGYILILILCVNGIQAANVYIKNKRKQQAYDESQKAQQGK